MKIDKTYSLQDIADILKRPRTTLSHWNQSYKNYIPAIGTGRTRRYKEEAIDVFRLIMDLKDHNEPNEVIEQYLSQASGEIILYEEDYEQQDGQMFTSIIKGYETVFNEMKEQRQILAEMYRQSQEDNAKLIAELQRIRSAQEKEHSDLITSLKDGQDLQSEVKELLEQLKEQKEEEKREIKERDELLVENLRNAVTSKEEKKGFWARLTGK